MKLAALLVAAVLDEQTSAMPRPMGFYISQWGCASVLFMNNSQKSVVKYHDINIQQETAEDGKAGLQSTDTNIIYGYLYIDTYIIYYW